MRFRRTYKERGILSLLSIGLSPVIEEVERGSGDGWPEAEQRWIAFYRAQGARLWNATEGGEGVIGEAARKYARERWAARTPEERSAIAQKIHANELPGQRAEWMKKARETQTREQLSSNGKRGGALSCLNQTAEQLSTRSSKANTTRWARMTPEERAEAIKTMHAPLTWEVRSAAAKAGKAKMSPEQRSAAVKKRAANMTPEQRSAIAQKAWRTKRQNSISPDNQL